MTARAEEFLKRLNGGQLLLTDGAWSTQMQKMGLESGECPEEWNLTHPDRVRQIVREYLEAGADLVTTNTFGGTRFRLVRHGFAEKVRDFNRAGVELCREVADQLGRGFVAASVGPTGEFVEPEGMLKEREMYDAFCEQMAALKDGGADGVCIETMYVLEEALLAVKAAKAAGLFCLACMTFESTPEGFSTMLGTTVERATSALDASGADVIGTNCGNGIAAMVRLTHRMRLFTRKRLLVKSNAGVPVIKDGQLTYEETAELMAAKIPELKSAGATIVGGCCGTTPEHIRRFRAVIDGLQSA